MAISRLPRNLPSLIRAEGVKVVELDGWHGNGRPGTFAPVGSLWHHTGSYDEIGDTADDLRYAKWLAFTGRSDLPAPLCQISISREGVVYMCAGGRANHAGKAKAHGSVAGGNGNTLYVGIECMNNGTQGWSHAQRDAMVKVATVLHRDVLKTSVKALAGHKETSVTGKWDPGNFDMDKFRADVAEAIKGEDEMNPAQERKLDEALASAKEANSWAKSARAQALAAHKAALENRAILEQIAKSGGVSIDLNAVADAVSDNLADRLKE